jgi:hypothetical protein
MSVDQSTTVNNIVTMTYFNWLPNKAITIMCALLTRAVDGQSLESIVKLANLGITWAIQCDAQLARDYYKFFKAARDGRMTINGIYHAHVISTGATPSIQLLLSIQTLNCSSCNLDRLPPMPNLTDLYCYNNALFELPMYLQLTFIVCSYNRLQMIPRFPQLSMLECDNNRLNWISKMPKLNTLICFNNRLAYLEVTPVISHLHCTGNAIKSLLVPSDAYVKCSPDCMLTYMKPNTNYL